MKKIEVSENRLKKLIGEYMSLLDNNCVSCARHLFSTCEQEEKRYPEFYEIEPSKPSKCKGEIKKWLVGK